MSATRSLRSRGAVLILAITLAGCATWRPAGQPVDQLLTGQDAPGKILVRLHDGSQFLLTDPRIRSDTLYGKRYPHGPALSEPAPGTKVALPLAAVDSVEVGGMSGVMRGLALALGIAAFALFFALIVAR